MGRRVDKGLGSKDRPELRRRSHLRQGKIKEQAYDPAFLVLNLSRRYGDERLEATCAHKLPRLTSPGYRHLKAMLDSNLDQCGPVDGRKREPAGAAAPKGHVRGADYHKD